MNFYYMIPEMKLFPKNSAYGVRDTVLEKSQINYFLFFTPQIFIKVLKHVQDISNKSDKSGNRLVAILTQQLQSLQTNDLLSIVQIFMEKIEKNEVLEGWYVIKL